VLPSSCLRLLSCPLLAVLFCCRPCCSSCCCFCCLCSCSCCACVRVLVSRALGSEAHLLNLQGRNKHGTAQD